MALARSTTLEAQEVHPRLKTETEVESSLQAGEEPVRQEDEKGLGNLSKYNFGKLLKKEKATWHKKDGYRNDKPLERKKESNWEAERCNCYSYQTCWAFTKEKWSDHTKECFQCKTWEERDCDVAGHDKETKRLVLDDLSNRRHVTELQLEKEGSNCCQERLCTHEFITHANYKIPWWACLSDDCEEHITQKIRSGTRPQIPFVTIMNTQECPCLRRGCLCNYDNQHPFQEALVSPPTNARIIGVLRKTIKDLEEHQEKRKMYEWRLKDEIMNIRQTKTTQGKQLSIKVKVGKTTITSIIDSGADINYVNKNWCDERKIHYKMIGWGWVRSYNGKKTRTKILEANVKMRIQGKFMRENFRVLEETGSDLLVLGDPWLTNENPDIDWKKRTVKFRAKLSTTRGERASNL
jgi:hypothetical protein